jgi:hypothetical protein
MDGITQSREKTREPIFVEVESVTEYQPILRKDRRKRGN